MVKGQNKFYNANGSAYQSEAVQDVKMLSPEEEKSFGGVETLNPGAPEHVADLFAVLEQAHHGLVAGTVGFIILYKMFLITLDIEKCGMLSRAWLIIARIIERYRTELPTKTISSRNEILFYIFTASSNKSLNENL